MGQRTSVLGGRAVYPEYHLHGLTGEVMPSENWEAWAGHTLSDRVKQAQPARLRKVEHEMAAVPDDDSEGQAFLQAVVVAAEGVIRWAERYADLAETLRWVAAASGQRR